jgi:hypothetical protein
MRVTASYPNLLHFQDLEAIFFLAHGEGKKFLAGFFAGVRRVVADCGVRFMGM